VASPWVARGDRCLADTSEAHLNLRRCDNETVVHYEYAGGYLAKVCETTSLAAGCDSSGAVFYLGSAGASGVSYDALGRRASVSTPAGTRSFSYLPGTQRLATDSFASSTAGLYARTLDYASRAPAGPLRQ